MDTPKPAADMTDDELRREWEAIEWDANDTVRSKELADELEKRQIDF